MNTILTIAALVSAVTTLVIVQAIVAHTKAKDEMKLIEAEREEAEVKLSIEKARKSAAEIEQITLATRDKLAATLSTMTKEQLAAYNNTLEEAQRPVVQYVPVTQFYPYNYGIWKFGG